MQAHIIMSEFLEKAFLRVALHKEGGKIIKEEWISQKMQSKYEIIL